MVFDFCTGCRCKSLIISRTVFKRRLKVQKRPISSNRDLVPQTLLPGSTGSGWTRVDGRTFLPPLPTFTNLQRAQNCWKKVSPDSGGTPEQTRTVRGLRELRMPSDEFRVQDDDERWETRLPRGLNPQHRNIIDVHWGFCIIDPQHKCNRPATRNLRWATKTSTKSCDEATKFF